RSWDYELLNLDVWSSDANLANVSAKLEHQQLGMQVGSAVLDWKFDADENTMAELNMLFCQSGREEDYREHMYKIPKMKLYDFFDKYYMKIIYADYGSCSNLPDIGDKFIPPWNKTTYIFTQCLPKVENYPDILPMGYYKFQIKIIGEVKVTFQMTAKVFPKQM
ncbi:hypothetical protein KR093_001550, partial [Drosophila rubida]